MAIDQKNLLSMCAGVVCLALIFISIILLVPTDVRTTVATTTTIPDATVVVRTKSWAENNCLFSTMKRMDMALLTFCYDREKNERLTIYCNGTAVFWSKEAFKKGCKIFQKIV